jgi:hypothetical protein
MAKGEGSFHFVGLFSGGRGGTSLEMKMKMYGGER